MKKYRTYFLLLFALGAFTGGIGRHDKKLEAYTHLAKQKQFDCVGQIIVNGDGIGSGVLIKPNIILTAAHVLIDVETKPDTIQMQGQTVIAFVPVKEIPVQDSNVRVSINGLLYHAKRIILHPNYLDSATKGNCDIALIELANEVRIESAILNTQTDELKSKVTGVGFGILGNAKKFDKIKLINFKNAGRNIIDSIGGFSFAGKPTMLYADFDHPSKKGCNKMGKAQPTDLEYIPSGGDSGGGLFRQKNGSWELIGICSGAQMDITQFKRTGYYGQIAEWTRVSAFTEWINTSFNTPK